MTARVVNANATANTKFDFGFGLMFPLLAPVPWVPVPVLVPSCRTFRGANREGCVSYVTLRIIRILMETIKNLYIGAQRLRLPSASVRTARSTSRPSGVSATRWEGALGASLKAALHNAAPSVPRALAPRLVLT